MWVPTGHYGGEVEARYATAIPARAGGRGLRRGGGACIRAARTAHAATPFIGGFSTISEIGSTVPANGDVNPYGVAVVRHSSGRLVRGDTLVSNFNAVSNLQGTGMTIVELAPDGTLMVFARLDAHHLPGTCPGGVGLTTALTVLPQDWVIVGSLPTRDGSAATAKAGCLIVLNANGRAVETFSGGPINGLWDMTPVSDDDSATLFVTERHWW